jgi:hypothetical protein
LGGAHLIPIAGHGTGVRQLGAVLTGTARRWQSCAADGCAEEWSPVLAAAVIAADGVSCLLVGSAALWLHGEPVAVRDVDLVIEPGEANLQRLRDVLTRIALRPRAISSARSLGWLPMVAVITSYGKVDCLLERGRLGWEQLKPVRDDYPGCRFRRAGR